VPGGRQQAGMQQASSRLEGSRQQAGRQPGFSSPDCLVAGQPTSAKCFLTSLTNDHVLPGNQKYPCGGMVVFTYFCRQPAVQRFCHWVQFSTFLAAVELHMYAVSRMWCPGEKTV
jgi:hypothetical protein